MGAVYSFCCNHPDKSLVDSNDVEGIVDSEKHGRSSGSTQDPAEENQRELDDPPNIIADPNVLRVNLAKQHAGDKFGFVNVPNGTRRTLTITKVLFARVLRVITTILNRFSSSSTTSSSTVSSQKVIKCSSSDNFTSDSFTLDSLETDLRNNLFMYVVFHFTRVLMFISVVMFTADALLFYEATVVRPPVFALPYIVPRFYEIKT